MLLKLLLAGLICFTHSEEVVELSHDDRKLVLITVATEDNDGLKRYVDSARHFGMEPEVIGLGQKWVGGNLRYDPGGAQKINILQKALTKYADAQDTVLLFTDAYDVAFQDTAEVILAKFDALKARVVISAEDLLWPDLTLEDKFPTTDGKRFLCSGGIIGYAPELVSIINHRTDVKDNEDDQLYYTHVYLDPVLREKYSIKLDHYATLFQNMNGAKEEIQLSENFLENIKYKTKPPVLHGNGPAKLAINWFGNYIPHMITEKRDAEVKSTVTFAMFVEYGTPFMDEYFQRVEQVVDAYGAGLVSLFIRSGVTKHHQQVLAFVERMGDKVANIKVVDPETMITTEKIKMAAVHYMQELKTDYIFFLDSYVQLTDVNVLKELVSVANNGRGIRVIAPLVKQWGAAWTNFWGALTHDGWYARSQDYMNIVNGEIDGVFNVPYINNAILAHHSAMDELLTKSYAPFSYGKLEADMSFCYRLREFGIFMYVLTKAANKDTDLLNGEHQTHYGRVLVLTDFKADKLYPDLWEQKLNPKDWEEKYIDPQLVKLIQSKNSADFSRPCQDVIGFPFVTVLFGKHLIATMEDNGGWSGARHKDSRISGGYENVPTDDIHMNQIGWEDEWKAILFTYMKPLVEMEYWGYNTECKSHMMFVVRYHLGGQKYLRPHHDASTWSLTVALNEKHVDFEGGGTYFTRYECLASPKIPGNGFIFPGRLTHQHAGQELISGRRYIIVSFMDP